jgi:membrane protease YdiL (CAAX protease family)
MLIIFAGNELYEYVCGICGVSLSAQEVANIIESFVSRGMLGGICVVLLGGIIVPVCEEIIFRGVVFQGFLSKTPFWVASIASSLIFALMHMEISSVLPIFAMGMIFCYSYKKSGSLLVPIAIHCVNNILSCVLLFV